MAGDPFVDAIIQHESGGDPNAESSAGATGLMQIEPSTAQTYGVDPAKLKDPKVNQAVGTKYFGDLVKRYKGNTRLALAAYNWGPSHIDKVGDNPDAWPKETQEYVPKVMASASDNAWGGFKPDDAAPPKGASWDSFTPDSATPSDKLRGMLKDPTLDTGSSTGKAAIKEERRVQAESERKAIEGGGSDMSDPFVENVTIGAVTGGLCVPLSGGFIPKTLAGKVLTGATAGTAEQYLYGWTAEKAGTYAERKAAESSNPTVQKAAPYIGTAAALASGIPTGAVLGGLESGAASLRSLPKDQEAAAREAATAAEGKLYETAPKDIHAFGQDVDAANRAASKRVEGVQKTAAEAQAPAMAQKAMTRFVGRTPEETQMGLESDPEDYALHRANMRNVVFGPINRIGDELGKQFEVATQGRITEPVKDVTPVSKTIADESKWLSEHGKTVSKPVQDLMDKLPKPAAGPEAEESQIADIMAGEGEKKAQTRYGQLYDNWVRANPRRAIQPEENRALIKEALGGPSATPPTVGELLGWRTEATKLAASQTDHNQVAALQIRDAIDQTLMDSGVQIPKGLREEWGTYKSVFNPSFRRSVATAANPADYGKALFENPKRALDIVKGATPDEKDSLKQIFADYVNTKRMTPMVMGKKVNPAVLKELFGDTPYQNIRPWTETPAKAIAWESARAASPDVQRLSQMGFQRELQTIAEERAKDVGDAGVKLAEKLGPSARGKLAKILAAKTPMDRAKIVEQEFPISPEQAQQLYQQAQMNPGKAAFDKVREAKLIEKGLKIDKVREDAAVAQLAKSQNDPTMNILKRRLLAWHLPMMIGGAAAGAAGGHAAGLGYQGAISGMIIGMMGANKLRDMLRPSLSTPEALRNYWHAIDMAPSVLNASRFGGRMARVTTAVALRKLDEQERKEAQR